MWIFILIFGCRSVEPKNLVFTEDSVFEQDIDADLDGYLRSEDCDDASPSINPGAVEVCDGRDNNCNGQIDEGVQSVFYLDSDADGFGSNLDIASDCEVPEGYTTAGNDCDDSAALIFPGAVEECDEVDNNCDGEIDENLGDLFYPDADLDGYGSNFEAIQKCEQPEGYLLQSGDCDDSDPLIFPGASEACDGVDNNCNNEIDEGGTLTWYLDSDGDGFGAIDQPIQACSVPQGYVENALDCNDSLSTVNPDAVEICDAVDNDCNGVSDDNAIDSLIWYIDADLDGFGSATSTANSCFQPVGYASNDDDCDDSRFESSPVSLEYCNGVDDDCDGIIDESDAVDTSIFFVDSDGDGYGDPYSPTASCNPISGYVENNQDCDDGASTIYPYAIEYCNSIDDNCNTLIDEVAVDQLLFYQDLDGDGYGGTVFELACEPSTGFVSLGGDCNDNEFNINPLSTEVCNEIDDNCDGATDEGLSTSQWYLDSDGDGYGDPDEVEYNCLQPPGYIAQGGDCDDTSDTINPNGTEVCNGLDDDCDGYSDAGSLGSDDLCAADSCLDILTEDPTSPDGMYYILFDTGIEQAQCDMGSFGGGWTQVFADDMSPPDVGWTLQTTTTCGIWGEILGGYGVISGGAFDNTIDTRDVPHTEVWTEMDYITLDSWDDTNSSWGPDIAYVQFEGNYIWYTDIDNHLSIYGQVCGWWRPSYPQGSYDSRHYVSTIEQGPLASFTLTVGSTLSQGPLDESFGLDDVYVWVR